MMPRLADPVLPLQTMNAHCMGVRIAALNAQNPAAVSIEEITRLIDMASVIRLALLDGHKAFKGDVSMQNRYETAGKALARVVVGLRAKRGDQ
jgi:hypothetical protein